MRVAASSTPATDGGKRVLALAAAVALFTLAGVAKLIPASGFSPTFAPGVSRVLAGIEIALGIALLLGSAGRTSVRLASAYLFGAIVYTGMNIFNVAPT